MKSMTLIRPAILSMVGLLIGRMASPANTISSGFETGVEGWTVNNTAAVAVSTGGNPGGYLFIDNPETTISEIIAPAPFHGDLRSFIGGMLSFDGNMLQAIGSPWSNPADYGKVTIAGPADTAMLNIVPGQPILGSWTTYGIDLNAATWGKTESQWENLLANVTSLRLSVEARFGGEQQGIDNFTLTPPIRLTIERAGNGVRVSWLRPAAGFVLEQTGALALAPAATIWSQVPFPYQTNSTQISVTVPTPIDNAFYRLRKL